MKKIRPIEKMLKEIAVENKLTYQSYANGWTMKIDNKFVTGYHFSLNNAASSRLCDDKASTTNFLSTAGLPVIPHEFFMEIDEIRFHAMMNAHNNDLVLKPNQGSGGVEVERISSLQDFIRSGRKILAGGNFLAVAPFMKFLNEFRIVVLFEKVELIYAKKINSGWKHNLGLGAEPLIFESHPELEAIAVKAAQALNINFASIDIAETLDGFKILEVNSGVMMDTFSSLSEENYLQAKDIYRRALEL
ncbi:MAG: RimK family alpha-L-glutamate ligase [Lactovum sp.]